MIKLTDHFFHIEKNQIYLIFYVSYLLSYVQIIIDRNSDLPKTIDYYKKDLHNITDYLNQGSNNRT